MALVSDSSIIYLMRSEAKFEKKKKNEIVIQWYYFFEFKLHRVYIF